MNEVFLIGRLAADPEIRYTQSGKAVADITIAVDVGFGDNKKTSFIPCTAWEKRAETIGNTLTKGRKIAVKGSWCQQNWETNEGQKRRKDYCLIDKFEFCDSKKDGQASSSGIESNIPDKYAKDNQLSDDSIPF